MTRGWRMRAIYATSTIVARAFWVAVFVSLVRVDWDSAKSVKSTRGCRSIAGADDKWGNGQLAESFPPFTRGAPRFASITERSVVSLVLIPGNYKLFVISRRDCAGSSGATRSPSATRRRISRIFCDGDAGASTWPVCPGVVWRFAPGSITSESFHAFGRCTLQCVISGEISRNRVRFLTIPIF